MKLSNTQKKVLAALLAITFPIWIVPVVFAYIVIGLTVLIYANIADALDVQ